MNQLLWRWSCSARSGRRGSLNSEVDPHGQSPGVVRGVVRAVYTGTAGHRAGIEDKDLIIEDIQTDRGVGHEALLTIGAREQSKKFSPGGHDPVSRLIDALWPDADGDTAHENFKKSLARLRKLLRVDDVIQWQAG